MTGVLLATVRIGVAGAPAVGLAAAPAGCGSSGKPLVSRTQTFAELRTVKRGVQVALPGEAKREPYARERLVDGEQISVAPGGLAWLRRDGGATLLVAGPAALVMRAEAVEVESGKIFADNQASAAADLGTPRGKIHLAGVRASVEVAKDAVSAYVLGGTLRTEQGVEVGQGERVAVGADGKPVKSAAVAWDDWTGGLATADPASRPAPFGVGTVGARPPGDRGKARFSLGIQRLDVRVTVDGDFAVTEVDEVFSNPTSETVEGIYRFRTPTGAVLQRFGVDRDHELVWGRVKEKESAAAQYQEHVYQGSTEDPALLEWQAPGVYQARLYPIKPGETRRVVTRYGEWLGRQGASGERRLYVYPMAAEGTAATLPRIDELRIDLDVARAHASEVRVGMQGKQAGDHVLVQGTDFVPRADLAVELFDGGSPALVAYRAPHTLDRETIAQDQLDRAERNAKGEADYLLVPVRPARGKEPEGGLDLAIVVDASAATERGALAIARAMTGALLAHLGPQDRAAVWAGDATLRPVADGTDKLAAVDAARRERIATGLAQVDRGGATDLGAILAEAASRLEAGRRGVLVYLGDGQPTVGEQQAVDLRRRLERLQVPVRLFPIGIGDRANMSLLGGIARGATAERVTDAFGAAQSALRVLEQAERPVWLGASIDLGPGVDRVFPRDVGALAVDETEIVVGRLVGAPPARLRVRGSGGALDAPLTVAPLADGGDLRRRWAEGRLAQLFDEGAGRAAVVELGVRFGVATPYTSLYVPTAAEYRSERERQEMAAAEDESKPWWRWPWFGRGRSRDYEQVAESTADNKEGGTGTRAKGEEGSMGNPNAKASGARYGVRGPADNEDPHVARQAALKEAAEFGMIGLLNTGAGGDPNAPSGTQGNAWGSSIGDSFGAGGLGLSGVGEGGGGRGDAVGLGSVGSLNLGAGAGTGQGFGSGHGRLGSVGTTTAGSPGGVGAAAAVEGPKGTALVGGASVSGGSVSNVDRVVAGMRAGFRACYNRGLASNPSLQGSVRITAKVGPSGEVLSVTAAGGGLGADVNGCITRRVQSAQFAPPEGGVARIVIPVVFGTGDVAPPPGPDPEKSRAKAPDAPKPTPAAEAWPVGGIGHQPRTCPPSADLPFEDRRTLWRERLSSAGGSVGAMSVYEVALRQCEAPTWRERTALLSLMVDFVPGVNDRVALYRLLAQSPAAADVVFRAILTRASTAADIRALHDALGIRRLDPTILAKALAGASSPEARAALLAGLVGKWPDDLELALTLLDAYEDANDDGAGRALARRLRQRGDATTRVRTAVGEYYLRLAAKEKGRAGEDDANEARRTFGEIVEFAPDDPAARRRLGDLLRAHGWFEEAMRQYETLAALTPDDPSSSVLLGAAAQGMGRVEEAIRWTEKAARSGSPDATSPLAKTSRALASAILAWAQGEAAQAGRQEEAERLRERARGLSAAEAPSLGTVKIVLTWSHPELRPDLWTNALGSPMPAADGDPTLGVAAALVPGSKADAFVELRMEDEDRARAERLGAEAVLTAIVDEGTKTARTSRVRITYAKDKAKTNARRRFRITGGELREEVL